MAAVTCTSEDTWPATHSEHDTPVHRILAQILRAVTLLQGASNSILGLLSPAAAPTPALCSGPAQS
jgi:hypothetical protein